jgi:Ca2+:H+ antiporter
MTSTIVNQARRQGVPTGTELDDLLAMSRGLSFILLAAYGMFLTFQLWSKFTSPSPPLPLRATAYTADNQPTHTFSDCPRSSRCTHYPTDLSLITPPSSLGPTGFHRWAAHPPTRPHRPTATVAPCDESGDGPCDPTLRTMLTPPTCLPLHPHHLEYLRRSPRPPPSHTSLTWNDKPNFPFMFDSSPLAGLPIMPRLDNLFDHQSAMSRKSGSCGQWVCSSRWLLLRVLLPNTSFRPSTA